MHRLYTVKPQVTQTVPKISNTPHISISHKDHVPHIYDVWEGIDQSPPCIPTQSFTASQQTRNAFQFKVLGSHIYPRQLYSILVLQMNNNAKKKAFCIFRQRTVPEVADNTGKVM